MGKAHEGLGSAEGRLALARLTRERKRIRAEDWATLFRQMGDAARQIAGHPFLKGDAEAEKRLTQMLMSENLEQMDAAFDHLSEYVDGKIAATLARRGEEPPAPKVKSGAASGKAIGRMGPSGDDFDVSAEAPRRQRAVIRL